MALRRPWSLLRWYQSVTHLVLHPFIKSIAPTSARPVQHGLQLELSVWDAVVETDAVHRSRTFGRLEGAIDDTEQSGTVHGNLVHTGTHVHVCAGEHAPPSLLFGTAGHDKRG